jgi:DNA helicase-2/ATP-dependent DNA helicase PcrA
LTEPQRQAAMHIDGPLLIIAGAGSGKTRVITRRVAYLLAQGIGPSSILALTFTNKAAGEMKSRISDVLGRPLRDFGRLDQPWPMICTFHSLCLRILRHYAERVGLPPHFSIFDAADQNKLVKEALKALDISSTNFPPGTVHGTISNAKNQLISAQAFASEAGDFYRKTVARAYTRYQQMLDENNALDFDDLLLRTAQALRDVPGVLQELQERFTYLMIDEYQDTNHAQYVIAHALAQANRNIAVVGDPDQSIYAWRGADIQNILDFEKDYPDAKVIRLEQNYRSTQRILTLASGLIAHNTRRKDKKLWTENPAGEPATVLLTTDEHEEAQAITQTLKELNKPGGKTGVGVRGGYDWNQMAIFYRMNSLSRVMEDALRRANVPYQIARGVEFYNRKEIKDVLAYLRVIANPRDALSLERIVNTPARGLGDTSLKLIAEFAVTQRLSLWEGLERADSVTISKRAQNAARQFISLITRWRRMADEPLPAPTGDAAPSGRVQRLMEDVVRVSGMEAHLKSIGGEELSELANVNELISSAAEYDKQNPDGTLDEYLSIISLVSDTDHLAGAGGAVTLMTLHAAKGLEFPVVAMIGMEDGLLPHSRARENPAELEEERRLAFVGITRAQERLIFSKAAIRTIRGMRERTISSPFLAELSPSDLRVLDMTGSGHVSRPSQESTSRQFSTQPQFTTGQMVRHPTFGIGRISQINEMGAQTRAIIEFNSAGRRTLILEYARLEPVG